MSVKGRKARNHLINGTQSRFPNDAKTLAELRMYWLRVVALGAEMWRSVAHGVVHRR